MNQTSNIERARTCKGCFYFAYGYDQSYCMALPGSKTVLTYANRVECIYFRAIPERKPKEKVKGTFLGGLGGTGQIKLGGGRPERREMECECGETVTSMGVEFECKKCGRKWEVTQ